MLDEYNRPIRLKAGRISIGNPDTFNVADGANGLENAAGNNRQGPSEVEITIQETLPEVTDQQQQKLIAFEEPSIAQDATLGDRDTTQSLQAPTPELEQQQEPLPEPIVEPVPVPVSGPAQPQLAPWEIRGDDMVEEEPSAENPEDDGAKPMSRAERRRKIKEDIQKLSQGDTPIYYQRRLW